MDNLLNMDWDKATQEKFKVMVAKIPVFHRYITEEVVTKGSQERAQQRGAVKVEEVDVISAFFSDVPAAFYSMMIRLMDQNGFNYKKYGFPKQ